MSERIKLQKEIYGISPTPIDANTVFAARLNGTAVDEISGQKLNLGTGIYKTMPTGLGVYFDNSNLKSIKFGVSTLTAFTFDAWFETASMYTLGNSTRILLELADSGATNQMGFSKATTGQNFYIYWGSGFSYFSLSIPQPTTLYTHVRLRSNGVNLYLYFNGILIHTRAIANLGLMTQASIGEIGNTTNWTYIGSVSDVHFSNIDRGNTFLTLPQDFSLGVAKLNSQPEEFRRIKSDALTSQSITKIISPITSNTLTQITGTNHKAYESVGATGMTPSTLSSEFDATEYGQIRVKDSVFKATSSATTGEYAYHNFVFDITKDANGNSLGSAAGITSALSKLKLGWSGKGQGDTGTAQDLSVDISVWDETLNTGTGGWIAVPTTVVTHATDSIPAELSLTSNLANYVDASGKIYFRARTKYPAGANSTAELSTDTVGLLVEMDKWATGRVFSVESVEGIVSGVIDADSALAAIIEYSSTNTIKVNDVSKLNVGDKVRYIDFSSFYIDSSELVVNNIDASTKSVTVDRTGSWKTTGVLIESTATTSSPAISALNDTLVSGKTAQAGGATTITLAADSSAVDDYYNTYQIKITSGTGAGQVNNISDYVGETKVATVGAWSVVPDNTSVYSIFKLAGTWANLGTKKATFTLTSPPTVNTENITVVYSANFPTGQGLAYVPSSVKDVVNSEAGIEVKGKTLVNLLGKLGNCEDVTRLTLVNITGALNSANYVYGSNSIIMTLAAGNTLGYAYNSSLSKLSAGKYYLTLCDVKNVNATYGVGLRVQATDESYTNIDSPFKNDATKFNTVYVKIAPTDFDTATQLKIGAFIYGSEGQSAYFDGLRLFEITQDEYNKIDVDPGYTGEKLAAKFPYIDSIQHKQGVMISQIGKNLIPAFNSGEWTLHANAVVDSDYSLTLNASENSQYSRCYLSVQRNTTYTISYGGNGKICVIGLPVDTTLVNYTTIQNITFNSKENDKLWIYLNNEILGAGTFTFTNPQLELARYSVISSAGTLTVIPVDDVTKFIVGDTVYVMTFSTKTLSTSTTISSIDTVNKTITVTSAKVCVIGDYLVNGMPTAWEAQTKSLAHTNLSIADGESVFLLPNNQSIYKELWAKGVSL